MKKPWKVIQSDLQIAIHEVGNMRTACELLNENPRFEGIGHPSLVRWLKLENPSPRLIYKMTCALEILKEKRKRRIRMTNPQRRMVLKALEDLSAIRRVLRSILQILK